MKTLVITGSTRGIGYGMADIALKRGCQVVINGRSQSSVDNALTKLKQANPNTKVIGVAGEVGNYQAMQALWDTAKAQFGTVDIWINNAGIDISRENYWEIPFAEIVSIFQTNLMGIMTTSHIVLRGMLEQGQGTLYNMEGLGSDGGFGNGMASYGTTKYALRYFTKALQRDLKDKPVIAGTMSPGVVITDLLMEDYKDKPKELERVKRIFNIIADTVETVSPYLIDHALANSSKKPAIAWLTTPKIAWRFMTSPFNKRNLFI
jgi:short-subunit dehydrogenase